VNRDGRLSAGDRAHFASGATIALALLALIVSLYPASQLGSEFMPTLNEGTLLYMPASLPGMSITKAAEVVQTQDKIIKSFPEVASVWGKAGRASTATDPAPTEMVETVINLKSEDQWRHGMTVDKLVSMDKSLHFRRLQCPDYAYQGAHRHASTGIRTRLSQGLRQRPN
jgi:Cu/Ag efflux pump CusA